MKRPEIPIEIIVEITGKCKLTCAYCTDSRRPHLPLKTILQVLDEAAEIGVQGIRITGGEPLLHPDIEAILAYAKSKNFMVLLNTAAEDIRPSLMKAITRNVDIALISLQGFSPQTNSTYTRSRACFVDKLKNIFFLKSQLQKIWLATVITPTMEEHFGKFLPLIEKINPAAWILLRPISEMNEDLRQMNVAFYRRLTIQVLKARQRNVNVYIGNPLPMCISGNLKIGKQAYFGANLDDGHVRLVYSAQGYFKPSYFLNNNLGNTLQTAWTHPFLQELERTDYLPKICQQCPVLDTCRGGCRAMALKVYGTPLAADPLFEETSATKAVRQPLASN